MGNPKTAAALHRPLEGYVVKFNGVSGGCDYEGFKDYVSLTSFVPPPEQQEAGRLVTGSFSGDYDDTFAHKASTLTGSTSAITEVEFVAIGRIDGRQWVPFETWKYSDVQIHKFDKTGEGMYGLFSANKVDHTIIMFGDDGTKKGQTVFKYDFSTGVRS